jgi:hypothetical protein
MRPPTYRERLRIEGAVLAGSGALGCALMLALHDAASEHAPSTVGQLVFVTILIAVFAPILVRRSLAGAQPLAQSADVGSGQPTALWKPPLVTIVLTALFVVPGELGVGTGGWDAGVRICGGCLLVGLAQAILFERLVGADERRTGRTFVRVAGTSAFGGTKLGFFGRKQV